MQSEDFQVYGVWQATSGVLAGDAMPVPVVSATKLTIGENTYLVDLAGNIDRGDCEIQLDTTPIRMQINGKSGPNAGKTFFAILEFVNVNEIRIAYDLTGTEFPVSFVPTSCKSNYVATFKRS